MDDQFLSEMNRDIIAVIKRHRANTATMAREIIKQKAIIEELEAAQRWIPVEERLPVEGQTAQVWNCEMVFVAEWQDGTWYETPYHTSDNITHWMPLPSAPKEAK